MEVHIYNVRAESEAGLIIMSQTYNDNIRPKQQDTQLGILKIYVFWWITQQRILGTGKSAAGVM